MADLFNGLLNYGVAQWRSKNYLRDLIWGLKLSGHRELIGVWSLPKDKRNALLMTPHKKMNGHDRS